MFQILVANSTDNSMQDLLVTFERHDDVSLTVVESGSQALDGLSSATFHLAVIAEKLQDIAGLELTKKIVTINPMINCANASDLAPEDFHEASEGLGILMQIPSHPKKEHGLALLKQIQRIEQFTESGLGKVLTQKNSRKE